MAINEQPPAVVHASTSRGHRSSVPEPADYVPGSWEALQGCVTLRMEEMVRQYADRVAVTDEGRSLTYRGLNTAANNVAAAVLQSPQNGDAPTAILFRHDLESFIAHVGVVKSGRPYIALDPGMPVARLQFMLRDAGPDCLITMRGLRPLAEQLLGESGLRLVYLEDIDLAAPSPDPGIYPDVDAPIGIFYTAGSTGEPKGLVHTHKSLMQNLRDHMYYARFAPSDRLSLLTHVSLGVSFASSFGPLTVGAASCLYDFMRRRPQEAAEWIDAQGITFLRATPSVFRAAFEQVPDGRIFRSLRIVRLGGEGGRASDLALFKAHTAPGSYFVHAFGSTDAGQITAVVLDHHSRVDGEFLPAGYPVEHKDIMLLDDDGQPVGPGEPGEIVIRSGYMAAGYWKQPHETARRYRPDPAHPGLTILYSGDMGRWLPDGALEFLGRKDFMVKVRGQAVDLAEVELTLLQHASVKEALVVARPSRLRADQSQLTAYVVRQPGAAVSAADLRAHLRSLLPEYMLPAYLVFLDGMPLNPHGKVDRAALPEPPERELLEEDDLPADDAEAKLVEIWRGILRAERIGVRDNFFEIGGDSLSVLSMIIEVEKAFETRVSREFFGQPTIQALAKLLSERWDEPAGAPQEFKLRSQHASAATRARRQVRSLASQLRGAAIDARNRIDPYYVLAWVLSRRTRGMGFEEAIQLVTREAGSPRVLQLILPSRAAMLRAVLGSLGESARYSTDLLRRTSIGNLLFQLIDGRRPFTPEQGWRFWDERRKHLAEITPAEMDERYPARGLAHLQRAMASRRGVILLSFHGTAHGRAAQQILSRRLGASIQTVAHKRAVEASEFRGAKDLLPSSVAGSLYAELAFYGQSLLRDGHIVNILGDTYAPGPGRTYTLTIGDRTYEVKPGFAELALNTGAEVVPVLGRFQDDGSLLFESRAALERGGGPREEQIRGLLKQYEAFINVSMREHPEMLSWKRIRTHLAHPRIRVDA